jgi:hypothetical protein
MRDKIDTNFMSITALNKLLYVIFEFNIFQYHGKYYIQINGVAMGCIAGPAIVVLFVYLLEIKWLTIHKPLFFFRFIDDITMGLTEPLNDNVF